MGAPLLQAEIDIEAPPAKVWELISDFRRMPDWSPQCRKMKGFGPLRVGQRTFNINRQGWKFWPTTSTVTEVVPNEKLAFKVDANYTVWTYELTPTATGTHVVETRRADNGIAKVSTVLTNTMMGGVPNFEIELVEGMQESLARIKAAAEQG